jgi:hypothetical protein
MRAADSAPPMTSVPYRGVTKASFTRPSETGGDRSLVGRVGRDFSPFAYGDQEVFARSE